MPWLTEQRLTYILLLLSIILNAFLGAGWLVERRAIGFLVWQRSAEQVIQRIANDVDALKKQGQTQPQPKPGG